MREGQEGSPQLVERTVRASFAGDQDDLITSPEALLFHPVDFSKTPLEAVPAMGLTDGPSQRNAELPDLGVFLELDVKSQQPVLQLAALLKDRLELPGLLEPLGGWKPRHTLSPRRPLLDADFMPALLAAPAQDGASPDGPHAATKAVDLLAFAAVRLVSPFHGSVPFLELP